MMNDVTPPHPFCIPTEIALLLTTLYTGTLQHLSDVFLFRRKLFTLASWMATLKQRRSLQTLWQV